MQFAKLSTAAETTDAPFKSRPYLMGISSMGSGIDHDNAKTDERMNEWRQAADLVNLFFHINWNALDKKPLLEGHEWIAHLGDEARKKGMKLSMVMDFTHDGRLKDDILSGVGLVNRCPDGRALPEGELANPAVQNAYQEELLALVRRIQPEYVFIGLEINIFLYRCPELWPPFVEMYKNCYDAIKAEFPDTSVSVYSAGVPNGKEINALRLLLPKLDNLAYSIYCDTPWEFPDGYLTRIRQLDPNLPLFIPEFGVRTFTGKSDEENQLRVLNYYLSAFASVETEAVVWCHLYDQDFSAGPVWFKDAFETIGLKRLDGTPKPAYQLWKETFELPMMFQDLWRVLLDGKK